MAPCRGHRGTEQCFTARVPLLGYLHKINMKWIEGVWFLGGEGFLNSVVGKAQRKWT